MPAEYWALKGSRLTVYPAMSVRHPVSGERYEIPLEVDAFHAALVFARLQARQHG